MGAAVLIIGALFIAAILIGCVEQGVSAIRRRRKQQFKALVRQRNVVKREITAAQVKHVAIFLAWCKRREYQEGKRRSIQARWDARRDRMRMERNTGPAMGATRRQGRL